METKLLKVIIYCCRVRMECLIGMSCNDFVMMAADQSTARYPEVPDGISLLLFLLIS